MSTAAMPLPAVNRALVRAKLAERDLRVFIREAWPHVEPGRPFVPGRHIDLVAELLMALVAPLAGQPVAGQQTVDARHLIVNMPPRHMKSRLVGVLFPAWLWLVWPEARILGASYAQPLATRDAVVTRDLIRSAWYQARWGGRFRLKRGQDEKMRYDNDQQGVRIATSVGGAATGEGGDVLILDDPHKIEDRDSPTQRQATLDWTDTTWSTRLNDPERGVRVTVMQRLHADDVTGHYLAQAAEGGDAVAHVALPAEYEPEHPHLSALDWRTEAGAPLWPTRFSSVRLQKLRTALGSQESAGLLQQRPSPAEGIEVNRAWWRRWSEPPGGVQELAFSWDCAFKDLSSSDYVVGQLWARAGARFFLLWQMRDRLGYVATRQAVLDAHQMALRPDGWLQQIAPGLTPYHLVEDKANGTAVIDDLRNTVPGLVPVEPQGGKVARARAVAPMVEAGNVYLPAAAVAPWVGEYVEEWASFPAGAHDDQVDATSQALTRMRLTSVTTEAY